MINNKVEKLVNNIERYLAQGMSHEEAKGLALRRLLDGTKYAIRYDRALKMAKVLAILINRRLISSGEFSKIADPYSWSKVRLLFPINVEYPDVKYDWLFTLDLSRFSEGIYP